ncbi:ASCH domain-containing protein [Oenococcus sicerae]|uniref:ASCH domain-containing protein n=1 Tax=Oenococcus sicerae TaxID=2203724 RepID=A0ABX5QP96_9LACO|nr:ASCH domain-containing protein [Oenococcus sicerae]QAS70651.1 ASCH domain-containing protein [Oenococcus sicerae]
MKIILSIKPEYANKIFNGTKKFEYRKVIFSRMDVDSVIVYSTMPEGLVIGEFKIENVLKGSPSEIWDTTKESAGISQKNFFNYFLEKKNAYAIKISQAIKYSSPKTLKDINKNIKNAPQSFVYVK